jgi:hypothetical protein
MIMSTIKIKRFETHKENTGMGTPRCASLLIVLVALSTTTASAQFLDSLTQPQAGRSMRASSGNSVDNSDSSQFAPGECQTIAHLKGPGKIAHIWFTPNSMDIRHPRAFVLRAYWDGAEVPSIEVPLGDFFAVGNGMQAEVNSLPVKVCSRGRGYNCYWQMPFAKEAKITLTNESDLRASCYFQIDWVQLEEAPDSTMYFHARYHQEYPPEFGKPYTAFVTEGRGHYVGTVLSSQNAIGHWFGEGDDMFYVDGEEVPSIQGTGTEDYINEAWNMRVHSGMFAGCTVFEPRAPDARVCAYRWHIADPIMFRKSLRFEIERRGFLMNAQGEVVAQSAPRPDFWSSVSFWYQDTIAKPWCEFPPYEDRVNPEVVLHLPQVVESRSGIPVTSSSRSTTTTAPLTRSRGSRCSTIASAVGSRFLSRFPKKACIRCPSSSICVKTTGSGKSPSTARNSTRRANRTSPAATGSASSTSFLQRRSIRRLTSSTSSARTRTKTTSTASAGTQDRHIPTPARHPCRTLRVRGLQRLGRRSQDRQASLQPDRRRFLGTKTALRRSDRMDRESTQTGTRDPLIAQRV